MTTPREAKISIYTRDFIHQKLISTGNALGQENILLDPNSELLKKTYLRLYQQVTLQNFQTIAGTLNIVKNFTASVLSSLDHYSNEFKIPDLFIEKAIESGMTVPLIPIDTYIQKRIGNCRHHSLLTAYFLAKLVDDGILQGEIIIFDVPLFTREGHLFNLFYDSLTGKLYYVDATLREAEIICISDLPVNTFDITLQQYVDGRLAPIEYQIRARCPNLFNTVHEVIKSLDIKLPETKIQRLHQLKKTKKEDILPLIWVINKIPAEELKETKDDLILARGHLLERISKAYKFPLNKKPPSGVEPLFFLMPSQITSIHTILDKYNDLMYSLLFNPDLLTALELVKRLPNPDQPEFNRILQNPQEVMVHCQTILAVREVVSAVEIKLSESQLQRVYDFKKIKKEDIFPLIWVINKIPAEELKDTTNELILARSHLLVRIAKHYTIALESKPPTVLAPLFSATHAQITTIHSILDQHIESLPYGRLFDPNLLTAIDLIEKQRPRPKDEKLIIARSLLLQRVAGIFSELKLYSELMQSPFGPMLLADHRKIKAIHAILDLHIPSLNFENMCELARSQSDYLESFLALMNSFKEQKFPEESRPSSSAILKEGVDNIKDNIYSIIFAKFSPNFKSPVFKKGHGTMVLLADTIKRYGDASLCLELFERFNEDTIAKITQLWDKFARNSKQNLTLSQKKMIAVDYNKYEQDIDWLEKHRLPERIHYHSFDSSTVLRDSKRAMIDRSNSLKIMNYIELAKKDLTLFKTKDKKALNTWHTIGIQDKANHIECEIKQLQEKLKDEETIANFPEAIIPLKNALNASRFSLLAPGLNARGARLEEIVSKQVWDFKEEKRTPIIKIKK